MVKILLVDDEPRQVRALANILTKLEPDSEVYTAGDGREALDFILQNRIDILMTDIRMPVMDGIELIERLSELGQKIRIVILSGYGEFEYAQKAIRFGVQDYLVKPISRDNLTELMQKFVQGIREDREQLQSQEELKKKLDSTLPVYLDRQLNKWIRGGLDGEGLGEIASIFPYKGCGAVIVTHLGKPYGSGPDAGGEQKDNLLRELKYLLKDALKPLGHSISFGLEGFPELLATVINSDEPFQFTGQEHWKRLKDLIGHVKNEHGITITLGLSRFSENIFEEVGERFSEALAAAERRFFAGRGTILSFDGTRSELSRTFNPGTLEAELSEAVRHGDTGTVASIVGKAFEKVNENSSCEPQRLKEEWEHLALNQIKVLLPFQTEEEYNRLVQETKADIAGCEDYRELWHSVNNILGRTAGLFVRESSRNSDASIEKCKKYLDASYMKEITLETVAQRYHFNPSYFSNLFKNSVGIGFSEYLNSIRIRNAQRLLKQTDGSMADIAAKVGFRDPAYFNRAFKRQTGLSPLKYRKLHEE
jgi:two-component system response regulator YesN